MSASAPVLAKVVVSAANTQDTATHAPLPWWNGLTLDQQDEWLDRVDPQLFGPGQVPPMPVSRWNREKKRVRRARQRWIEEIRSLRRPCRCKNCRRFSLPPFPKYYVVNGISYECWLEEHVVDPELEEDLAALANDRRRAGSAIVGRQRSEYSPSIYRGGI